MPAILETQLLWPDEAAAQATAKSLAAALLPSLQKAPDRSKVSESPSGGLALGGRSGGTMNALIELHGPLGAGKTTFVRLLLRALGVEGRIKSPSYAVMESYELPESSGGGTASHFVFYRFGDPREWEDAGFRDVFAAPGLKLCEWPEKAAGQLPPPDLQLFIELMPDDSRQVRAVGAPALVEALT